VAKSPLARPTQRNKATSRRIEFAKGQRGWRSRLQTVPVPPPPPQKPPEKFLPAGPCVVRLLVGRGCVASALGGPLLHPLGFGGFHPLPTSLARENVPPPSPREGNGTTPLPPSPPIGLPLKFIRTRGPSLQKGDEVRRTAHQGELAAPCTNRTSACEKRPFRSVPTLPLLSGDGTRTCPGHCWQGLSEKRTAALFERGSPPPPPPRRASARRFSVHILSAPRKPDARLASSQRHLPTLSRAAKAILERLSSLLGRATGPRLPSPTIFCGALRHRTAHLAARDKPTTSRGPAGGTCACWPTWKWQGRALQVVPSRPATPHIAGSDGIGLVFAGGQAPSSVRAPCLVSACPRRRRPTILMHHLRRPRAGQKI